MDTTTLTFEEFENQVEANLEDWPMRSKDCSHPDGSFELYEFETVGPGYEGHYSLSEWAVMSKLNYKCVGKGETLEAAMIDLEDALEQYRISTSIGVR